MAAIRNRSPSEIQLEKKLLNCLPSYSEKSGTLFGFFKDRAKELITYHLDKPKRPRRLSKENYSEDYETSTPQRTPSKTPQKGSLRKKLKPSQPKEYVESEPSDDFKRLKDMVGKKAFVIDSVINSVSSQKKTLNTIKMTTNREHLLKQVDEVDECNENVIRELETLSLSLHDAMRQIDKISQIHSFQATNLTKDLNVEFQENLNKERRKYESQIKALQDFNKSLSSLPKATEVEKEFNKKLGETQNKLNNCQSSLAEKSENLKKKQAEVTELLVSLSEKDSEARRLESEIKNLKDVIRTQESNFLSENSVLKSDMIKLEKILKDGSTSQEQGLKKELVFSAQTIQIKDREIAKLKTDILALEDQIRHLSSETELKHRNAAEMHEEVMRLSELLKSSSKTDSHEIVFLRQALEEKDRQLAMEREKFAVDLDTVEKHRIKQKNEWAEIYTGLKHEIKELKQTIIDLSTKR